MSDQTDTGHKFHKKKKKKTWQKLQLHSQHFSRDCIKKFTLNKLTLFYNQLVSQNSLSKYKIQRHLIKKIIIIIRGTAALINWKYMAHPILLFFSVSSPACFCPDPSKSGAEECYCGFDRNLQPQPVPVAASWQTAALYYPPLWGTQEFNNDRYNKSADLYRPVLWRSATARAITTL